MMCNRFAKLIQTYHSIYQTIVGCEYLKYREDEPYERSVIPSVTTQIVNLTKLQLNNIDPDSEIRNKIHTVEMVGSGRNLQKIIYSEVEFYKQNGIRGNSYVKLPMRSNAFLNIQNEEKFCFIWSILAKSYPINKHAYRVEYYKNHFNKYNISDIDFTKSMHISDIPKFERLKNNLSKNVFEL